MHRSGTSFIANWLHEYGLNLGDRLLGSGIGNINGHYEDLDFFELHKEILVSNNLSPTGLVTKEVRLNYYYKKN